MIAGRNLLVKIINEVMEIAFYKTPCSFEVLPMFTINIVEHNGRKAYCIMLGWLQWILDIQWTTTNN